jgi:signal transduction histidine kinase
MIEKLTNRNLIATIVSYLMIVAVSLLGITEYPDKRNQTIPILVVFLLMMIVQPLLPPNRKALSAIYIAFQMLLMVALYFIVPQVDYWAILLIPSIIYAVRVFGPEIGLIWVAIFTIVVSIIIIDRHGFGVALVYFAAYIFFASYAYLLDKTEKAQAESQQLLEELRKSNQKLEELASNAEDLARIKERNRLARELHDSVTQSLYSLSLLAGGWRRLAVKGELDNIEGTFAEIEEVAQQGLKEMRLLIYELRPPALDDEGLQGALHYRLSAVEKRAGVEAHLEMDSVLHLKPEVEETLYAVAVEALNNALKHASASTVMVKLHAVDSCLRMEVMDNGAGFDPLRAKESSGLGLKSMRERVEDLNGKLEITSKPGAGTNVKVEVEV